MVRAEILKFLFLAVKANFWKRTRFIQRANAEQTLQLSNGNGASIRFARQLRQRQRMLEATRTENKYGGQYFRLLDVFSEPVIHHQVARGAVELRLRLAAFGVRQQIAKHIGPKLVEALPGDPIRGPTAFRIGSEYNGPSEPILPAHQQRLFLVNFENGVRTGFGDEPDIPFERRCGINSDTVQNLEFFATAGLNVFSTAVEPVCSITSFKRICSSPDGSFKKYDLPPAVEATFSR